MKIFNKAHHPPLLSLKKKKKSKIYKYINLFYHKFNSLLFTVKSILSVCAHMTRVETEY